MYTLLPEEDQHFVYFCLLLCLLCLKSWPACSFLLEFRVGYCFLTFTLYFESSNCRLSVDHRQLGGHHSCWVLGQSHWSKAGSSWPSGTPPIHRSRSLSQREDGCSWLSDWASHVAKPEPRHCLRCNPVSICTFPWRLSFFRVPFWFHTGQLSAFWLLLSCNSRKLAIEALIFVLLFGFFVGSFLVPSAMAS